MRDFSDVDSVDPGLERRLIRQKIGRLIPIALVDVVAIRTLELTDRICILEPLHLFGQRRKLPLQSLVGFLKRHGICPEKPRILSFELGIGQITDLALEGVRDMSHKGHGGRRDQSITQHADGCPICLDGYFIDPSGAAFGEQEFVALEEAEAIGRAERQGCLECHDISNSTARLALDPHELPTRHDVCVQRAVCTEDDPIDSLQTIVLHEHLEHLRPRRKPQDTAVGCI